MLEHKGNPFIKNRKGESIDEHFSATNIQQLTRNTQSQLEEIQNVDNIFKKVGENIEEIQNQLEKRENIVQKLKDKIEYLRKQQLELLTSNNFVHQAVMENNFYKLKWYRFFSASLESFNMKGEVPLEIAMKNENVEIMLYLMEHTNNVFENVSLAPKVFDFLAKKIKEKNEISPPLIEKYSETWEKFFNYRDGHEPTDLDDEIVNDVFRGNSIWECRKGKPEASCKEHQRGIQEYQSS